MAEPYFRPGETEGKPPSSPTQFDPAKPAGPDPVSPQPLPEGSEIDRHAQLFAYDPSSGQFKPVTWKGGKLAVDMEGDIQIGAVEIKNRDTDDRAVVDVDGSLHTTRVEKINGLPIQTVITRDADGLVYQIAESDGVKTKTSTIARDADLCVASIAEAIS